MRILTIVFASIFPVLLLIKFVLGSPIGEMWLAVLGISFFLLVLLVAAIAVRAAGCLSGECERNTLDALLTTRLDSAAIVNEKWLGSLLSVRRGAILLTLGWVICALLGILAWQALPFLLLVAGSWMCLAASLGVFCSLRCRTTWRAIVVTVGILLAVGAFPWMMGWHDLTPIEMFYTVLDPQLWQNRLTDRALAPGDSRFFAGVLLYSVLAVLLWSATHLFLPRVTGRMR